MTESVFLLDSSDMYMSRSKFSNKTVSTVNSLNDGSRLKRKEDYNWRKELEE